MVQNEIHGKPFFSSWSGGKDSCLSLYRALQKGGSADLLLTMMVEGGERSRSHGIPLELLQLQAQSLNIPLQTASASWEAYETVFIRQLKTIRESGIADGVFGDIDLTDHLQWVNRVCETSNINAHEPLWQNDRLLLLTELIELGFKAMIVSINTQKLGRDFLGQTIDFELIEKMKKAGIDPSGELGEYHTAVLDGPLFLFPINITPTGFSENSGYSFLDYTFSADNNQAGYPGH